MVNWPCFALGLFILCNAVANHNAQAVKTRTVQPDQTQCGRTFGLGLDSTEVFRVMMPQHGVCPSKSSFVCSVFFQFSQQSEEKDQFTQICVDFARITLYGAETKISISEGKNNHSSIVLTSTRFPLITDMDTVRCFSNKKIVNITFSSVCTNTTGYALRNYFASWIYVYYQQPSSGLVYHIDGTCQHRKRVAFTDRLLTIRSFLWQDVAHRLEQNCSLEVQTYDTHGTDMSIMLCSEWRFQHAPCQVSASFQHKQCRDHFDCDHSKNFTCHSIARRPWNYKGMDGCVPFSRNRSPLFKVSGNPSAGLSNFRSVQDGSLFFEVVAHISSEAERKDYADHSTHSNKGDSDFEGSDSVPSYSASTGSNQYMDRRIFWKVILPLVFICGICLCSCAVCKKMCKKTEDETSPAASGAGDCSQTAPQATAVLEPLVPPTSNAAYRPYSSATRQPRYRSDDAQNDRSAENALAAPPPAYGDVAYMTPSNQYSSSVVETETAASALEDSHADVPPPSFVDQPSAAPPAYHELFPSRT